MMQTAEIEVKEHNLLDALKGFFKTLLQKGEIGALMLPQHLPMKNSVMPTLVTNPEKIDGADPLAPVFPMNAAKVASKLTRRPVGGLVAIVLRPCEIRAFIELVKLKQAELGDIVLIGMDCLGRYENADFVKLRSGERGGTEDFLEAAC